MEATRFDGWTRRRFGLVAGALLPTVLGITQWQESTAKQKDSRHAKVAFTAQDDSGVSGFANLQQVKNGTKIEVLAKGLTPGDEYISIYYGNNTCTLEPDSIPNDIISGGPYTANAAGIGHTQGEADDDLDEILSVSVRRNDANHTLLACADLTA